jgi:hypothetical protein
MCEQTIVKIPNMKCDKKTHPVGIIVFHAGGQTDMTKLMATLLRICT